MPSVTPIAFAANLHIVQNDRVMTDGSLRERKKLATRRALQRAGLRLAVEHGADHITVEMICEAAGVSPRTFFNYFPGKDDALAGDGPPMPRAEHIRALATASSGGDLLADIRAVIIATAEENDLDHEELLLRKRLLNACPALLPRHMAQFARFERALAEAVAERTGTDIEADVLPGLMAAVATAAMRVSFRRWTDGGCVRPLTYYLDESFTVLRERPLSGDGADT
jgi:AcrR family transcriptional regulator